LRRTARLHDEQHHARGEERAHTHVHSAARAARPLTPLGANGFSAPRDSTYHVVFAVRRGGIVRCLRPPQPALASLPAKGPAAAGPFVACLIDQSMTCTTSRVDGSTR